MSHHNTHLTESLLAGTAVHEQIERETAAVRNGAIKYRRMVREAVDRGDGGGLPPVQMLMVRWFPALRKEIRARQRGAVSAEEGQIGATVFGPILTLLHPDRAAVCVMNEVMRQLMKGEAKVGALSYAVGTALVAEIHMDLLRIQNKENSKKIEARLHEMGVMTHAEKADFIKSNRSPLKQLSLMCERISAYKTNWWAKKTLEDPVWSRTVCASLGLGMVWDLVGIADCGSVDGEFKGAFKYEKRAEGQGKGKVKTISYLRLSERCESLLQGAFSAREHLRPTLQAMIVEPAPWREKVGGYYRIRQSLMGKLDWDQRQAVAATDFTKVYAGVDALNATPCRINRRIHEVQRAIWESGGGIAGIPPRDLTPIPQKPMTDDPALIKAGRVERAKIHEKNREAKSQRRYWELVMAEVDDLLDRPAFWQPHQIDFRGRVYPLPNFPNHQADDPQRALYQFANAVETGERGLWWIKVHLAGMMGLDKLPFAERVAFVEANMHHVEAWATDPIEHQGWLYEADGKKENKKAFQVLAAAFALFHPEDAARLPVQVDGTCNGLQHYAALGRDPVGAAAVNLMPCGRPADVYADVAVLVQDAIREDIAKGHRIAQMTMDLLHPGRKVCKAIVMPSVYGITEVGGKQAILALLDEATDGQRAALDRDDRYAIADYLTRKIFKGLSGVCVGADRIMKWVAACSKRIAENGHPVAWTTPLGLRVVQGYRRASKVRIRTLGQSIQLDHVDGKCPVSVGKQTDGAPPNFVHSLDSTHLLMTAAACRNLGIDLLTVHDAYAGHAAHMDKLGKVIREQFVALHKPDLLQDLLAQWKAQHPRMVFPDPPAPGELDLRQVMDSEYFFA